MQRHYKGAAHGALGGGALLAAASAAGARKRPRRARVARGRHPQGRRIARGRAAERALVDQDVSGKTSEAWSGPAWLLARGMRGAWA